MTSPLASAPLIPLPLAVLWDLDGTLADTLPDIAWALGQARAELGLSPCAEDRVRSWVGGGAGLLVARSLGAADESDPRVAPLLTSFLEWYARHPADRSLLYPGIGEMLARLDAAGVALACATNKPDAVAGRVLAALGIAGRFRAIVTPEGAGARKPDPRFLAHTLALLDVAPQDAILVGDGMHDVLAGRGAGVRVIAALWGYGDPAALRASDADWCVASVDELDRRLQREPGEAPFALIVEDDPDILRMFCSMLQPEGYEVCACTSAEEAARRLGDRDPDLFVVDSRLPGRHGTALFRELERRLPDLAARSVLVTGLSSDPDVRALLESRAVGLLEKPFRVHAFVEMCRRRTRRR